MLHFKNSSVPLFLAFLKSIIFLFYVQQIIFNYEELDLNNLVRIILETI